MRQLSLLLALATLPFGALAGGLPPDVLKALKTAQIPAANVAVVVQPVDAGLPLVAHNATSAMNPASVMKLVTTYAALDVLGPAWTWKTGAWIDNAATMETMAGPRNTEATAGRTVDGHLNGNLYLKGSGDPHFAIEHLSALLRQLRVRGIRHIAGDVVLDRTVFNIPASDPGAFDDKPMRPYNVGGPRSNSGLLVVRRLKEELGVSDKLDAPWHSPTPPKLTAGTPPIIPPAPENDSDSMRRLGLILDGTIFGKPKELPDVPSKLEEMRGEAKLPPLATPPFVPPRLKS